MMRLGRGALWSITFLPDGRLVSGGGFGLAIHDPDTLAVAREVRCGIGVRRLAAHPDGAHALVWGYLRGRAVIAEVTQVLAHEGSRGSFTNSPTRLWT